MSAPQVLIGDLPNFQFQPSSPPYALRAFPETGGPDALVLQITL
ncbi:Unknown protein sequence [Pseudomonas coronafaciens pv. oryzae]|nr:Unknown protein sequence [Pseudomonas coronafaciens pv. oryzae]